MSSGLKVGDRFSTQAEALEAVKRYGNATNQLFVIAGGNAKTAKTHKLREKFQYSSITLICKHGGGYKPHRKGEESTSRTVTATLKTGCAAEIRMKLVNGMMEVMDPYGKLH